MSAQLREEIAEARRRLVAAEDEVMRLRSERADLQAARAAAAAASDRAQVARLDKQLKRVESGLAAAGAAVAPARSDLDNARLALDQEAGDNPFSLLTSVHPLLLLPVRLETRFAWTDDFRTWAFGEAPTFASQRVLLIRVFPDDIHADSHEPWPTGQERAWQERFQQKVTAGRDLVDFIDAWAELVADAGYPRAAFLAHTSATAPTVLRPGLWSRAPRASLLPDRWHVRATVEVAERVVDLDDSFSELVADPLEAAPDPAGWAEDPTATLAGLVSPGMRWMVDFEQARQVGMAHVLTLPAPFVTVRRLSVLGLRTQLDAQGTSDAVRSHLAGAHYTHGLSMPVPGTPTTSTLTARTPARLPTTIEDIFRIDGDMLPLVDLPHLSDGQKGGPGLAGTDTATALGIPADAFDTVDGAWQPTARASQLVRTLLVAAFARPFRRALGTSLSDEDAKELFSFFTEHVSALGPTATLRVRDTPYGVLPIIAPDDPDGAPDSPFERRLTSLLTRLRGLWREVPVPELGTGKRYLDQLTGVSLLQALATDAVTSWVGLRAALGPESAEDLLHGQRRRAYDDQQRAVREQLNSVGVTLHGDEKLTGTLLDQLEAEMTVPLIQRAPRVAADGTVSVPAGLETPAGYLRLLTFADHAPEAFGLAQLARDTSADYIVPGVRPRTLLFEICRLAILTAADDAAREIIIGQNPALAQLRSRWDEENPPAFDLAGPIDLAGDRSRLEWPDEQTSTPIGIALLNDLTRAGRLPEVLTNIRSLARLLRPEDGLTRDERRFTAHDLEVVLRAELGSLSYRLDAWITALASSRLARLRASAPLGVHLGGYGVVEHVRDPGVGGRTPVPTAELPEDHEGTVYQDRDNAGYVHAPSVGHATTAGILLSEHIARRNSKWDGTFAVTLSSARVRRALHTLDGLRHQQPLGALLGYRIEKVLKQHQHGPAAIGRLRAAAPIVADKLTPSDGRPTEATAADNVVDGLLLLERAGLHTGDGIDDAKIRAAVPDLTDAQLPAVRDALAEAVDVLDGLADLRLAEGVHQIVIGNQARANAAAGAVPGAGILPEDVAVTRTPRTGINLLHRVLVAAPTISSADLARITEDNPAGWADTPRASASPAAEALARRVLPDPAAIRLRVVSIDPAGMEVATSHTLADLNTAAADRADLRISALDLVYARPAAHLTDQDMAPGEPLETGLVSPLEQRLVELFTQAGGLDAHTGVRVATDHDNADPSAFGLADTLEIAHTLHATLATARPVAPADLVTPDSASTHELRPGDTTAALDSARQRLAALRARLDQLAADAVDGAGHRDWRLLDTEAARRALFEADQFGLPDAVPAWPANPSASPAWPNHLDDAAARLLTATDLGVRVAATADESRRRLQADAKAPSTPMLDPGEGPGAAETHLLRSLHERGEALFGGGFAVTATLEPLTEGGRAVFTQAAAPKNAKPAQVRRMLARTGRVRVAVARLEAVLACAELTRHAAAGPVASTVHQYPPDPNAEWTAHAPTPGGLVSVVAALPLGTPKEGRLCGFWVDEFTEVVPSTEETTAVGFHYDAPSNAAPNLALLVVPGRTYDDDVAPWEPDWVWSAIDEALDLARLRAVGTDQVPVRGQLTPALWSWAANASQPCLDINALTTPPPASK